MLEIHCRCSRYKAWSFVRGISSELGDQAQGVLGVQNNLEAVRANRPGGSL